MDYQVKIDVLAHHVRVEVSGTRVPGQVTDNSLALWKKVAGICKEKQINHVLAVFNLQGERTLSDTLKIIEGVRPWIWPELMLAYIDNDQISSDSNGMLEQITLSHGISFRAFASEEQGLRWLKNFQP